MPGWTIRRAAARDAEALATCMEAAYAPYEKQLGPLPPLQADYAEEIAGNEVWVAEREGQIIGGLILAPGDGFLTLANVAVHPDSHGKGLGRALIDLAESRASGSGYREIRLNTHVAMADNLSLYTRLGWCERARHGTIVSMKKNLIPAVPDGDH